ncbi:hypothetical protein KAU09_05535 [Candidatus Parcubacteria bacterium]|nr:hypothetical protein [Candidatus Parcubacteria bacterium]
MENQSQELPKKEKVKSNLGQILKALCGVVVIIFMLSTNGLYLPTSAEAIGWDAWTLAVIFFGGWLIYSAFKQWKK